jgi:hypothetical protein
MSHNVFEFTGYTTGSKDYYDVQMRYGYGSTPGQGADITLSMHIDCISMLNEVCETIIRNHGRCEKCQEKPL